MKILLKTNLTLFICSLLLFSCAKDKLDETVVLKSIIANHNDCTCEPFINKYLWKNKIVYVLAFKGPTCDWTPSYFNEEGVEFNMENNYTLDNFIEESSFLKNIWTCQNN